MGTARKFVAAAFALAIAGVTGVPPAGAEPPEAGRGASAAATPLGVGAVEVAGGVQRLAGHAGGAPAVSRIDPTRPSWPVPFDSGRAATDATVPDLGPSDPPPTVLKRIVPAGNLDGHGGDDAFVLVTGGPRIVVEGRRGNYGRLLFSRELPAATSYGSVVPARVGPEAVAGAFIFASTTTRPSANSSETTTTVTAINGSGAALWSRSFTSRYGTFGTTYRLDERTVFSGLIQSRPGRADDVVVHRFVQTQATPVSQYAKEHTFGFLNGADGAVDMPGNDPCGCTFHWVGPDVDGDGFDDLLRVRDQANSDYGFSVGFGHLEALRSSDLATVWTSDLPAGPWWSGYDTNPAVGDANGDGRPEVVIGGDGWADGAVVDGASGRVLWNQPLPGYGWMARAGDADADGAVDVGIVETLYDGSRFTLRFTNRRVVDGATGAVAEFSTTVAADGDDWLSAQIEFDAGDLDADGMPDAGYRIVRHTPTGDGDYLDKVVSKRMVSGRTFATLWKGFAVGIGGSLDGAGDDVILWRETRHEPYGWSTQMTVLDGRSGAARWSKTFPGDANTQQRVDLEVLDVNNDGLTDLALTQRSFTRSCRGNTCEYGYAVKGLVVRHHGATAWTT